MPPVRGTTVSHPTGALGGEGGLARGHSVRCSEWRRRLGLKMFLPRAGEGLPGGAGEHCGHPQESALV